jgi:HSP20 family protein
MWGGMLAPSEQGFGPMRLWDLGVTENDKEVVVRAEIPGFEEKELDIQLHNDVLTIKAEKEQKGEGREEYRSYSRTITLPPGVEAEKAQASYRNGVLEMRFPRAESSRPRRIAIQGQQATAPQEEARRRPTGDGNKAQAAPATQGSKT